jgi:hypothetical protein
MFNSSSFPALCCRRGMESLPIFVLQGVYGIVISSQYVDVINDFRVQNSPVKGSTVSYFVNMNF